MATEKRINSRIIHKHDTEENWLKATNFIPKEGELIIYDVDEEHDYPRLKIGDGHNYVQNLPFANDFTPVEEALAQKSQVQIITWEADD